MRTLILASAALALIVAAPAYAAPAKKADPAAAAAPANTTAPADTAKKAKTSKAKKADAATPAAGAPAAKAKGTGNTKMSDCAAQWHKLSDAQKADWKAKGAAMKSKKSGKPLNDYQAFSSDCMKK